MAGRMMSDRFGSVDAFASSSTNMSCFAPVLALMRTIGAPTSSERSTSVIGAAPVCARSMFGTCVRIVGPTLKPSFRLESLDSIGMFVAFRGIPRLLKLTRLPVSFVPSGNVNQSFGNGYMHSLGSRKSHVQVQLSAQVPPPAPHEDPGGSHCSPASSVPLL